MPGQRTPTCRPGLRDGKPPDSCAAPDEAQRQRQGFTGGEQNTNSDIIAETFEAASAYVMGRRMADGGEIPWGEDPPFRAPVFVVTHRPRPPLHRDGGTSFTY